MVSFFISPFFLIIWSVLVLSSLLVAVVGTMMESGHLEHIAGSIAHSILGGVGLAVWIKISIWTGTSLVAVVVCAIFAWTMTYYPHYLKVVSNIAWGVGMSLGVLFSSFATGYQQGLSSFLFGNIVLVSSHDMYMIGFITLSICLCFFALYRQLLLSWFSPIFVRIQRLPRLFLSFISILFVALAIISLVKTMGIALALILLSVPQHVSRMFAYRLRNIIMLSFVLSLMSMFFGVVISYMCQTPAGATIGLVCFALYLIPLLLRFKIRR